MLHHRSTLARAAVTFAIAGTLVLGCSDDEDRTTAPGDTTPAEAAPDFSLVDVNETSATADELVSPRDHVGRVSAWYFGHAT